MRLSEAVDEKLYTSIVKVTRGLIEKQHEGIPHEGSRQSYSRLISFREIAYENIRIRLEPPTRKSLLHARASLELRKQLEIFSHRQPSVQKQVMREKADLAGKGV
jgi:hypothetical protein